jgi:hypothetical protein
MLYLIDIQYNNIITISNILTLYIIHHYVIEVFEIYHCISLNINTLTPL